jgi:hypothetical protein
VANRLLSKPEAAEYLSVPKGTLRENTAGKQGGSTAERLQAAELESTEPGAVESITTAEALTLLIRHVAEGLTTLYCADTDEHGIAVWCASILFGDSVSTIEERPAGDPTAYAAVLDRLAGTGWSYGPLQANGLTMKLAAFKTLRDRAPDIIFCPGHCADLIALACRSGARIYAVRD